MNREVDEINCLGRHGNKMAGSELGQTPEALGKLVNL